MTGFRVRADARPGMTAESFGRILASLKRSGITAITSTSIREPGCERACESRPSISDIVAPAATSITVTTGA
jgi:hypothetical protein